MSNQFPVEALSVGRPPPEPILRDDDGHEWEPSGKGFAGDDMHIPWPMGIFHCGTPGEIRDGRQQYQDGCGADYISQVMLEDHQMVCPEVPDRAKAVIYDAMSDGEQREIFARLPESVKQEIEARDEMEREDERPDASRRHPGRAAGG